MTPFCLLSVLLVKKARTVGLPSTLKASHDLTDGVLNRDVVVGKLYHLNKVFSRPASLLYWITRLIVSQNSLTI